MEPGLESLYDTVAQRLSSAWRGHDVSKHSRSFRCQCGRHVFFRNSLCIACSTPLGYLPDRSAVVPLSPGSAPGRWRVADARARVQALRQSRHARRVQLAAARR